MALSDHDHLRLDLDDLVYSVRRWARPGVHASHVQNGTADARSRQIGRELYRLFRLLAPGRARRDDTDGAIIEVDCTDVERRFYRAFTE